MAAARRQRLDIHRISLGRRDECSVAYSTSRQPAARSLLVAECTCAPGANPATSPRGACMSGRVTARHRCRRTHEQPRQRHCGGCPRKHEGGADGRRGRRPEFRPRARPTALSAANWRSATRSPRALRVSRPRARGARAEREAVLSTGGGRSRRAWPPVCAIAFVRSAERPAGAAPVTLGGVLLAEKFLA